MNFSIIIPTYDGCESLRRLLFGIDRHFGEVDIEHEVIVANNAPDDESARRIEDVVGEFQQNPGGRFRQVRESSTANVGH
jgi:hypothetical protein